MESKSFGYHRISDDSVSSYTVFSTFDDLDKKVEEFKKEFRTSTDIDEAWIRNGNDGSVEFREKKMSEAPEHKEYLTSVSFRNGRYYVTREITDINGTFTKWDFMSATERAELEVAPFTANGIGACSKCGKELETEADFAKHYVISDLRYLNLGYCPNDTIEL